MLDNHIKSHETPPSTYPCYRFAGQNHQKTTNALVKIVGAESETLLKPRAQNATTNYTLPIILTCIVLMFRFIDVICHLTPISIKCKENNSKICTQGHCVINRTSISWMKKSG